MNVTLQLISLSQPSVELAVTNDTGDCQYVAAPRIEPGALDGNYFQFSPGAAPFLGIQVKRAPYSAEELIGIQPGETLTRVYDLGTMYDLTDAFPARVRYRAMHPVGGASRVALVESPWLDLRE